MKMLRVATKDLRSMLRERTFMSIIALQFFVALFASVLTFGLLVLYNPSFVGFAIERDVKIGFVGDAPILEEIVKPDIRYESIRVALDDFYAGGIDAIVWLPKENLSAFNFVRLYFPKEEIKAIQTSIVLKDRLVEYQKTLREMRGIPSSIDVVTYSTELKRIEVARDISIPFKFIYVILIPLLMITTAATAAGMFIDSLSEELETKTICVLLSTPAREEDVIGGKMLAAIILAATLTPTWILLLMLNGIEIRNVFFVILVAISIAILFISLASAVVAFVKDRERAQLLFSLIIIALIPLLFTSPSTPAGLIARMAAGSPFNPLYVMLYFSISIALIVLLPKLLRFTFTMQTS
jgi:ABC-type Na+ efflux pump permease subunit